MPSRLGTLAERALADRQVTHQEVTHLVKEARADGKVSSAERQQLSQLLASHADAFEPSSRERVLAVVEQRRPQLPDPALPTDLPRSTRWREAKGELFVGGASPADPVQGKLGDCYLIATLSSLAHSNPQAVEDMVKDNGDGTFDVRFYNMVGLRGREAWVTVDGDLPSAGVVRRREVGADARTELWVSVTEKAFAQWRGSVRAIARGGQPDEVMALVTGRPHWRNAMYNFTPDEAFAKLEAQLARGGLVVAATGAGTGARELGGKGLVGNHAYSVLGVSTEGDARYVVLRNPWGKRDPGAAGARDGVLKLPLAEFHRHFDSFYTGQVP